MTKILACHVERRRGRSRDISMIATVIGIVLLNILSLISYADTGGRLLVSSHNSGQVFRYNETNGAFIDVMVSAGSGGLSQPHGLAFGPDRNLYVASAGNDRVLRYNGESGDFIDTFVTNGSGGLDYPAGILFGPDGHLYVASQLSDRVLRYNGLTGAFIDAFVPDGSGGLDGPSVPVFGPDSNLYVTGRFDNRVYKYNGKDGTFISVFVTNQLSQPFGCAFGPDGNLYVASGNNNVIRRFNGTTGVFVNDFVTNGLSFPVQFIFGPDTNIYACSFNGGVVRRYNGLTGALIDTFVVTGDGLNGPNFLTFRPAGSGPLDRDGDGVSDADEMTAGTSLIDSNDFFRVLTISEDGNVMISFPSLTSRVYGLHFSDDLFYSAWSNWAGSYETFTNGNVTSFAITNGLAEDRVFRVTVGTP